MDHIDKNAANHALTNLQVLCFKCNRDRVGGKSEVERSNVRVFRAALALKEERGEIPSNKEVSSRAGIPVGGATYLLKFLRTITAADGDEPKLDADVNDVEAQADAEAEAEADELVASTSADVCPSQLPRRAGCTRSLPSCSQPISS